MLDLLPGEDLDRADAQDARHWIAIYSELAAFIEDTLRKTGGDHERRQPVPPDSEFGALLREQQRIGQRLTFWRSRYFELAGLEMDGVKHTVRYKENTLFLTRREYQLLSFLLEHPHRSFSAEQLIALAWRKDELSPEEVRTYIGRLRKRLAMLAGSYRLITRPREGYSIEVG
ncbi:MAG: response regulator transcription factor [Chloroflexi bacterium]|nr:MAG: response regulator transcription factor [Chloroflexota bacterium]TMG35450.1 MAG: response regulator transcription factor [Chloroflexota bacterium]